jgi:hypothetical protein
MPTRQEETWDLLKRTGAVPSDLPVLPTPQSWEDVLGILDSLLDDEHAYRVLGIDTIGGCERLCHEHVCQRHFKGDWGERGFAGYMRGYEVSLAEWREYLGRLDGLRDQRGVTVILLGHTRVKQWKNPEGPDYDRYTVDVHDKTWALTHKWADAVLLANYYVEVEQDSGKRAKGRGGQQRFLYTEYSAAYDAKNRLGLPSEISMGNSGAEAWNNLKDAIVAALQPKGGE